VMDLRVAQAGDRAFVIEMAIPLPLLVRAVGITAPR
jgi:hypothetical protein